MSMIELKPCPFCGGEANLEVNEHNFRSYYFVTCDNEDCKVMPATDVFDSAQEAADAWNTRADNQ